MKRRKIQSHGTHGRITVRAITNILEQSISVKYAEVSALRLGLYTFVLKKREGNIAVCVGGTMFSVSKQ